MATQKEREVESKYWSNRITLTLNPDNYTWLMTIEKPRRWLGYAVIQSMRRPMLHTTLQRQARRSKSSYLIGVDTIGSGLMTVTQNPSSLVEVSEVIFATGEISEIDYNGYELGSVEMRFRDINKSIWISEIPEASFETLKKLQKETHKENKNADGEDCYACEVKKKDDGVRHHFCTFCQKVKDIVSKYGGCEECSDKRANTLPEDKDGFVKEPEVEIKLCDDCEGRFKEITKAPWIAVRDPYMKGEYALTESDFYGYRREKGGESEEGDVEDK